MGKKNLEYIYKMEFDFVIRKNEITVFSKKGIKLKIMLNKI